MKTINLTLFIADKALNKLTAALDIRPPWKYYVNSYHTLITTKSKINDKYFMRMINRSFEKDTDPLIVGIDYYGEIYMREGVKVISDGSYEYWIKGR